MKKIIKSDIYRRMKINTEKMKIALMEDGLSLLVGNKRSVLLNDGII